MKFFCFWPRWSKRNHVYPTTYHNPSSPNFLSQNMTQPFFFQDTGDQAMKDSDPFTYKRQTRRAPSPPRLTGKLWREGREPRQSTANFLIWGGAAYHPGRRRLWFTREICGESPSNVRHQLVRAVRKLLEPGEGRCKRSTEETAWHSHRARNDAHSRQPDWKTSQFMEPWEGYSERSHLDSGELLSLN